MATSDHTTETRPRFSIQKAALAMMIGALLVGQMLMLEEIGRYEDINTIFEVAVLGIFVYPLWPQVDWAISRLEEKVVSYVSRGRDQDDEPEHHTQTLFDRLPWIVFFGGAIGTAVFGIQLAWDGEAQAAQGAFGVAVMMLTVTGILYWVNQPTSER